VRVAVLAAALAGTAVIGGGTLLAVRRALHAVLWELCVLEYRAQFWVRACIFELIAGVAFAATIGATLSRDAGSAVLAITAVIRWEIAGAVVGITVLGLVVWRESRITR